MKDILPPRALPQRRNFWQRTRSLFMRWVLAKMKLNPIPLLAFLSGAGLVAGQTITDPAHIEVFITPYYNSKGPTIEVGPFSSGLAAKNEPEFLATIAKMKNSWDRLNFPETYVAAIRLYDLGYRKESIYW